jgi:hypothetical protein
MALAAINAGAVAIGTAFASRTEPSHPSAAFMPNNTLVLVHHATPSAVGEPPMFLPITPTVEHLLHTILPRAAWTERRAVDGTFNDGIDVGPGASTGKTIQIGPGTSLSPVGDGKRVAALAEGQVFAVADPAVLQLVGLAPADAATLQHAGLLALPEGIGGTNSSSVRVTVGNGATARTVSVPIAKHHLRATAGITVLITADEAERLRAPIEPAGMIVTNPTSFNETQRASIDALTPMIMFGQSAGPGDATDGITEVLWPGPRSNAISPDTVRQIILAIVVFIALVVLAMSLALSAAETRDERDVLVSLGARPKTMRGVASWKAAVLAFTGAALAIPTGFIPVAIAYIAAARPGEHAQLGFPWYTALELLLIAPIIAAIVAAIGSAVAQHFRPTQMSTFATD